MTICLHSDQQYNALETDWLRLKSYWHANQIMKYYRNPSELAGWISRSVCAF